MSRSKSNQKRRKRLLRRALPLALIAIVSFAFGAAVGHRPSAAVEAAEKFSLAWAERDYARMHSLLGDNAREAITPEEFAGVYREAERVATLEALEVERPGNERSSGSATIVPVELRIQTRAFGLIEETFELTYVDGGIEWGRHHVFPGLRNGEVLTSEIALPERAPIHTRDGIPLAEGPAESRSSPLGGSALDVTGMIGSPDETAKERLLSLGLSTETPVGTSGLEKAFNVELIGKPGGRLLAQATGEEPRVLAAGRPRAAGPLKTTVDSTLQIAAVGALAGRSGGIVVLDTRNGAVRALAGQAFSAPQPPGSTYKVLTTAAALEEGLVKLDDYYEPVQGINVSGRFIRNAYSEYCGGDFTEVFARSCNSAFLPMGPELGNEKMVEIAERFGFNSQPQLYNSAATAIIDPPASTIPTDMSNEEELAVSGIGQGRVLATPLQMASVAQTIANGGVRTSTPIVQAEALRPEGKPERVMPPRVAKVLNDLMVAVVNDGTGIAGSITAAQVAGKTGTAELGPKPDQGDLGPDEEPEQMVTAWFIAFAPAENPRLAIAVMLVNSDADGGAVAAPAAAQVLAAGIG